MRVRRHRGGRKVFQAMPPQQVAVERIGFHFLGRKKIAVGNHVTFEKIAAFARPDRADVALAPVPRIFGAYLAERWGPDDTETSVIPAINQNGSDIIKAFRDDFESGRPARGFGRGRVNGFNRRDKAVMVLQNGPRDKIRRQINN